MSAVLTATPEARPQAFHGPDEISAPAGSREEYDLDACRQLYMSIIELAVQDYRFLRRMELSASSSRYERKKLRQMTEDGDPREFFQSTWFEEVCDYVGVHPDVIRDRLEQEDEEPAVRVA